MSRQQEERRRVLCEMIDRFGYDDPMVSQWDIDVRSLALLDLHYPLQFPAWSCVKMLSVALYAGHNDAGNSLTSLPFPSITAPGALPHH